MLFDGSFPIATRHSLDVLALFHHRGLCGLGLGGHHQVRLGKVPDAEAVVYDVVGSIANQGFEELKITIGYVNCQRMLRSSHRNLFDKMLSSQAHDSILISNETLFDKYGARRLW